MSITTIPQQLDALTTDTVPMHLQVGAILYAFWQHYGLPLRDIEYSVYQSLRQEYLRSLCRDEDALTDTETALSHAPKSLEQLRDEYQARVDKVTDYIADNRTHDGRVKIQVEGYEHKERSPKVIAEYLSDLYKEPIYDSHVRQARQKFTRVKR